MEKFHLNDEEYIPLNHLLKLLQWVETGGMANIVITEGAVKVNGQPELQKRKKIRAGDLVKFEGNTVEVVNSDQ
jgi:ribosome-associated protein